MIAQEQAELEIEGREAKKTRERTAKVGRSRSQKGIPGGARAGRLYPPARCLRSCYRASKAEKRPRGRAARAARTARGGGKRNACRPLFLEPGRRGSRSARSFRAVDIECACVGYIQAQLIRLEERQTGRPSRGPETCVGAKTPLGFPRSKRKRRAVRAVRHQGL